MAYKCHVDIFIFVKTRKCHTKRGDYRAWQGGKNWGNVSGIWLSLLIWNTCWPLAKHFLVALTFV